MVKTSEKKYLTLDQPVVLKHLFHPRFEDRYRPSKENRDDLMIPVEGDVNIGASFHFVDEGAPNLLFFHGNGEIVSDYDDLAGLFNDIGINFVVVDYRGYGKSTGAPTVTTMMKDCHIIFDFILDYIDKRSLRGRLSVMGRSLGSASALELASVRNDEFSTLIIESGFASAAALLRKLGLDPDSIGFNEEQGFENIDKIKSYSNPCLIIHAEYDHIIPFSDGQSLYDSCTSKDKTLLEIKGANHNDIFIRGMDTYLSHLKNICNQ